MKSEAKNSFLLKPLVRALMTVGGKPAGFGLLATLPALAMAQTLPTGGQVVAGNANISQPNAGSMVINQGSDKAIINWQGFSIGANGYVQFVMPGSGSISLNRVVGQDPSSILGHLSSNGQVFLVNPNGVYFGANATVDVAGIVASTMNIRNEDFMRGDFRFKRDPNAPANATVINAGSINANGGYVVLAGDYVSNSGLIQAQLGSVMLASGNAMTLQLAGSSLVNYAIDEATLAQLAGVNNAGQILASGGKVIMTAEVANQLAGTVVNNSGLVQAQGTVEKDGAIYLTGKGGDVVNSGKLDAGGGQNGRAGSVQMLASGDLVHEAGSSITVDGAQQGVSNGGSVDTWADGKNRFKEGATITARGGVEGGDGGFVELSGNAVSYRGKVDLLASKGKGGTLLIDPTNITIKDGSGEDDSATFYETNLESALAGSGQVILQATNSGEGQTASILMEHLSDGVLNGSGTAGLTLKVSATNGASGSILFQNLNDSITVGGQLSLSVDDGAGTGLGSINVGKLQSKTGIDLKAGSISANSLSVLNATSTITDASYGIMARATTGDLNVSGDVRVEVSNDQATAVGTTVDLKADAGAITVGGKVTSNATGLGYYHYNWITDGAAATTYYGQQPWSITSQGDHAISSKLSIVAGNNSDISIGGDVQALATDNNTAFTTNGIGGYWQTAAATVHNFWRPTAATAQATITAGGNVTIGGNTSVKADGYAVSAYSESESWRQMVNNFNYTSGTQTVYTNYGCLSNDVPCTGGYGYRDSYVYTDNRLKGSATGNYIWQFGPYVYNLPSTSSNSPTTYTTTDYNVGSIDGPMSYSGARGLSATLNVTAGKAVSMGGLDVRANNHSATGAGSYTDVNWGHQDTASNLNNTSSSFTSANRETDYYDTLSTSYSAASTDAQANIVAGAGSAITINGTGANVVASNTTMSVGGTNLDYARLSLLAGSGAGAQDGVIQLNSPVLVEGSSDRSINLIVQNKDGAINQDAAANISVINHYYQGDASASFSADRASATLGAVSVNAGRAASLTATANQDLATGNLSATGSTTATIALEATQGALNATGSVTATAATSSITLTSGTAMVTDGAITANATSAAGSATVNLNAGDTLTTNADVKANALQSTFTGFYPFWTVVGGAASVSLNSVNDLTVNGNVAANAYSNAALTLASQQGAVTLAAGKSATAQATGNAVDPLYIYNYASSLSVIGQTGLTLDGSLSSSALNGTASMSIKTLGGADAQISQGTNSLASVSGRSASLQIKAGDDQATVADMAAAQLNGALNVTASQGDAQLQLQAASGTVNNFNVLATAGKGSASLSALNGDLALTGTSSVSGNSNTSDGARLTVNSSGVLQADAATINVSNNNTGTLSAASASFTAGSTPEASSTLGTVTVSNSNNASLTASAAGPLQVSGTLSTVAGGVNGVAQTSLSSTQDALEITDTGSVKARAVGTGGNATTSLTAVTGLTVNGNLLADAGNQGTLNVTSTGGTDAAINQGAASEMKAAGTTATLNINAGDATPTAQNAAAIALAGALKAQASSGAAAITINVKSGSVHDVSATSLSNSAAVQVQALNGDLSLDGTVGLSGNANNSTGATLDLSASGALDTSAASITVTNNSLGAQAGALATLNAGTAMTLGGFSVGANQGATLNASAVDLTAAGDVTTTAYATTGVAQTNLTASNGNLNVNAGKTVRSSSAGDASTTLVALNRIFVDGDVKASGTNGVASTSLTTLNGSGAGINQGAASTIGADGSTANVYINAGAETPTVSTAAALELAGSINAAASSGSASINLNGKSVSLHDLSATSQSGNAGVQVNALYGDVTLNGSTNVSGNLDSSGGVSLGLASTYGKVDTSAASITLNNSSSGTHAGAVANLNAGDAMILGDFSLSANRSATLNATSTAGLTAAGNIGTTARAATGNAQTNLTSDHGSLTVNAGKTVSATSAGNASATLMARDGMQIDGDVSASAGTIVGSANIGLTTTGGVNAGINQGSASNIVADGALGAVSVLAGSQTPDQDSAAGVSLAGLLKAHAGNGLANVDIQAASGSLNNVQALSDNGNAQITVQGKDANGTLTLNGTLQAQGNNNSDLGALLSVGSTGSIDASAATINVSNLSTGSDALAKASMTTTGGDLTSGAMTVGGQNAQIELRAPGHLLTQGDITLTGVASAGLTMQSGGTLDLQSDLHLSATNGEAIANLSTTVNSSADIVQGANRNLIIEGNTARALMAANGGKLNLGGNTTVNSAGDGGIYAGGTEVALNNFAVTSTSGKAAASFSSGVGDIVLKGVGTLTGAGDAWDGAHLSLNSKGSIDTRLGSIDVSNTSTGEWASALIDMTARNGGIQSGVISASTDGGGIAGIAMQARQAVAVNGDISAVNAGQGTASVEIQSGVSNTINVMAFLPPPQVQLTGSITQLAGTTIKANSNSGDAVVDLQAGNCCNGSIALAGTVEAKVAQGAGNAGISMRGTQITANQLRANTGLTGTGAANISLIASDTININGVVDLQARNRDARADLQLVADKLNWSGASTLSDNNAHIQLAPFSPDRLIGVDSDQDFDATVQTNYSQAMLKNFMGHGAEVTFGGVVDRTAFSWSSLKNLAQQSADIHVAANGPLNLGDVKMVFDTTGTTYYHDPRMSPWSVPTGRVAIFVARPNVDRYLDRTENTLQNMTRSLENNNPGSGSGNTPSANPAGSGPVTGTTHVGGNLYMAGNGVNMDSGAESGKGEGTGTAGQAGKPTAGSQPEQDRERERQSGTGQPG